MVPLPFSLKNLSNLRELDGISIHRFLRRNAIERTVVFSRLLLVCACLLFVALICREYFRNSLVLSTKVKKFDNSFDAAVKDLAKPPSAKSKDKRDYSRIANKSILGKIGTDNASKNIAPTPKPTNYTPLTLVGTFLNNGMGEYAIIQEGKRNTQEMFEKGSMIFREAKLLEIFPDRVEIERGGQKETLIIDLKGGGSDSSGAGGSDSDFTVDEAELNQALDNLPLLLTQARAVPFFKEGRAVGLRLFAVKSGSLFEKIGLKNGDVLKSVNGNSLGDLSQALQLFQKLKEERTISLVLERDQKERSFRYSIR